MIRRQSGEDKAKNNRLEFIALCGFCLSGVIFVAVGLRSGDWLTVLGSLVWIASCLLWMIPHIKR